MRHFAGDLLTSILPRNNGSPPAGLRAMRSLARIGPVWGFLLKGLPIKVVWSNSRLVHCVPDTIPSMRYRRCQ